MNQQQSSLSDFFLSKNFPVPAKTGAKKKTGKTSKSASKEKKKNDAKKTNRRDWKKAQEITVKLPLTAFYGNKAYSVNEEWFPGVFSGEDVICLSASIVNEEQVSDDVLDNGIANKTVVPYNEVAINVDANTDERCIEDEQRISNEEKDASKEKVDSSTGNSASDEEEHTGPKVTAMDILNKIKEIDNFPHLTEKSVKFDYCKDQSYLGIVYVPGTKGAASIGDDLLTDIYHNPVYSYSLSGSEVSVFDFHLKRIPWSALYPFLKLVLSTAAVCKECMGILYYDIVSGNYIMDIPEQIGTEKLLRYVPSEKFKDQRTFYMVMHIHSHHRMPAFFSSQDDLDDIHPLFYMVFGDIDLENANWNYRLRLKLNGDCGYYVPDTEILFDLGGV